MTNISMKIDRKLYRIDKADLGYFSLLVIALYFISLLVAWLLLRGRNVTFFELAFILSVSPVITIALRLAVNRNGVLVISETDNLSRVQKLVENSAQKFNYFASSTTGNRIDFKSKSGWGKLLNFFFRENLTLTTEEDILTIFGKRNVLKWFESDIRKAIKSGRIN